MNGPLCSKMSDIILMAILLALVSYILSLIMFSKQLLHDYIDIFQKEYLMYLYDIFNCLRKLFQIITYVPNGSIWACLEKKICVKSKILLFHTKTVIYNNIKKNS